ncbi:hypothetical protein VNI00_002529 [Paramarasmius palmivorus]|uniref:Uncharacterized protein n=1 Tax=Paramarasmius palmivorus TaxID=297713 RepID=A0AAW0DYW4_9AGAR
MGGSAFKSLASTAFPRLPPQLYHEQKARFTRVIQDHYVEVAVPSEAPEKETHGDIDYLVCTPRVPTSGAVNVPHETIKDALGAAHVIPMEGNRTSNFAVPISQAERQTSALSGDGDCEDDVKYYQVDIHVCNDSEELKRIFFFHSYGDLGMILGLVAQNVGLAWGTNGLKYSHPPHPAIILCTSHDEIAAFFGLSMERWNAGFKTRAEVFEWVRTSRFFDPSYFQSGLQKVKQDRAMYFQFTKWADGLERELPMSKEDILRRREQVRQEALVYFNKKDELEAYYRLIKNRQLLKESFTGHTVSAWTGLGEHWRAVKQVMDTVRNAHGGDEGLAGIIEEEGEEGVRKRVMDAYNSLGFATAN